MEVEFMRENNGLLRAFAAADFLQASAMVVTECYIGERIWVKCVGEDGMNDIWGGPENKWSSFSGTMIYAYI